uniref:Vacuolar protein sorting-associated protein 13 DH-like domain-containing protein n=1 Tax=Proboscia inermis TaxID=420281 RepID=A0A7S0CCM6_9STRA
MVVDSTIMAQSSTSLRSSPKKKVNQNDDLIKNAAMNAAMKTVSLVSNRALPNEQEAQYQAFFAYGVFDQKLEAKALSSVMEKYQRRVKPNEDKKDDLVYSFRAFFQGFTLSFVDAEPSEIAVVSLKNVDISAKWNKIRSQTATIRASIGFLQVDNHCPSAPFPVAVRPNEKMDENEYDGDELKKSNENSQVPFLLVALTFAPEHSSGITCFEQVKISPKDVSIAVDLAFIVRVQRYLLGIQEHFDSCSTSETSYGYGGLVAYSESRQVWPAPNLVKIFEDVEYSAAIGVGVGCQKNYFESLIFLPCKVNLSVAPARALTSVQSLLEGTDAAAIHAAVRKGDLLVKGASNPGLLGVKIGSKNRTALSVIRGVFKSIVVDALLRCESAVLVFPGIAFNNHNSNTQQLTTHLAAHYLAAFRGNLPALFGSLSAFGNPVGLIRGLGDGVSDFVSEPIKGLKKSVAELDPIFALDGVARGTGSLARHTVGSIAGSASLLTETLSKNMAVLTLDRKYAQRRDRKSLDREGGNFVEGVGSGGVKFFKGVMDGVTGVYRAPMRGAEKRGVEGFAKGVGKGLLGLLVKPVIGLTDAATDVMIGVKGSVECGGGGLKLRGTRRVQQIRPRRALYGRERALRSYNIADASASLLMMKTRLAGERFWSQHDLGNRVVLLSVRRLVVLDWSCNEIQTVKFKYVKSFEARKIPIPDGGSQWAAVIYLRVSRRDGGQVAVISCQYKEIAVELCTQLKRGIAASAAYSQSHS